MGEKIYETLPIRRVVDQRGWFVKPISGKEPGLEHLGGEFYLVMAEPGEIRGNHYHEIATEWFTIVQGHAELHLQDIASCERKVISLSADEPQCVVIRPGVAHAFLNPSHADGQMILTAFTNQMFDPSDTKALKIV
jgi:dTDP-4-dehydrorhamnose 3,5-epimerase-like enzyme